MKDIGMVQEGASGKYTRDAVPYSGIEDEHTYEYWCGLMGYDNETGFYVDHNQVHRSYDNRFVAVSWFENIHSVMCEPPRARRSPRSPEITDVQFNFQIDEGSQRHTTFSQYTPNETNQDELDTTYDLSIGGSLGYGPLSVGLSVSSSSEEMDFEPYQHLMYDTSVSWGGVPTRDDKLTGFATDIDSDLPAGETFNVALSSQADYIFVCSGLVPFSTPEASFVSMPIEVVDD